MMENVGSLPVVILGCTGVGFKALGIFQRNGHEVYGFLGEKPEGFFSSSQDGWEVLGALSEANVAKWMALDSRIVFFEAIDFHKGEPYRSLLGDRLINAVDIRAVISGSLPLIRGILVDTGAYLGQGVSLCSGVVIGAYACLDAGVFVGEGVQIGAMSVIGQQVSIGSHTLVGPQAYIAPKLRIGKRAYIAPGAVVLEEVPDEGIMVGNPARVRENS